MGSNITKKKFQNFFDQNLKYKENIDSFKCFIKHKPSCKQCEYAYNIIEQF